MVDPQRCSGSHSPTTLRLTSLLVLALSNLSVQQVSGQTCPPQGATLTISPSGPVPLATPVSFFVSGKPLKPYALLMDAQSNPRQIPGIGCVYLGLTPSLVEVINGLRFPWAVIPPNGTAQLNFYIPNDSKLLGVKAYFQAFVANANSLDLSNGAFIDIQKRPLQLYLTDRYRGDVRIFTAATSGCPKQATPATLQLASTNLAAHHASGRLYVARYSSNEVALVDMTTNKDTGQRIKNIPRPQAMTVDGPGTSVFILSKTDQHEWQVRRARTKDNTITHTWNPTPAVTGAPLDWEEADIAIDASNQRIYFSRPGGITVLNASDLSFVSTILASPTAEQNGIFKGLVFRRGKQELWASGVTGIWIVNTAGKTPFFVDINGQPTTKAAYPGGPIQDVTFSPTTGLAYASTGNSNNLLRLTPGSTTIAKFPILAGTNNGRLEISPGGNLLVSVLKHSAGCAGIPRTVVVQLGSIPKVLCNPPGISGCNTIGSIVFW